MANADFQRSPKKGKFAYHGVDFHHPPDLMPANRCPFLLNVSPNIIDGTLQARPGMTLLAAVNPGEILHSIIRLNDSIPGATNPYARFVGSQDLLFAGLTSFMQIDSGYSGNPLSFVPYEPPVSPEPWLYVFDSAKTQKYKADLVTQANIGIAVPDVAPTTALSEPGYTPIIDADPAISPLSWTNSGDAGTVSTYGRLPSYSGPDDISAVAFVYDSGSTGWADVALANSDDTGFGWLGLGMRIMVDEEYTTVEQVFTVTEGTTVAGILYDSGSTGLCTVAVVSPQQALVRNQLIKIGTQYIRVLSVTAGPDGKYSFRASTASTVSTGAAITFLPGFRAYFISTHTTASTFTGSDYTCTLTYSTGQGLVTSPVFDPPLDLTLTSTGDTGASLIAEDYMHVSFYTDTPENLLQVMFLLDVDASVNNFTENYYYYIARQGDFTPIVSGVSTAVPALLNAITADIADSFDAEAEQQTVGQSPYPTAPLANPSGSTPQGSAQMPSGSGQWFECTIKFSDLVRVGSDMSVGLYTVKTLGLAFTLTGNAQVQWGSWWVGGGFGPDANFNSYGNQGIPIQYRYRYRSSTTGARSDVSPETRNGELPRRQQVLVSVTASADSQVDLIDIERFGGTVNTWKQVLTVPNATGAVIDSITQAYAEGSQPLDLKQYVPFPVTDIPHTGTANVVGTKVNWVSGAKFNTSWIRGVEVIINEQTYTLYAPPATNETFELEENAGVYPGVVFSIPEATIAGQPLPYAWESKGNDRIMACGDPYNPGRLYFTQAGNPDSAADDGYIDITNPSEPLIGGGHYEGADYVFTTLGVYRVEASSGVNPFVSYKLSLTYGLAGSWCFTTKAPFIFLVSTDGGIYAYNPAGQSERLTNDLYPLFPHEGEPGQPYQIPYFNYLPSVSVVYPPDFSMPQFMRLEFVNYQLFFDFIDTQGAYYTFCWDSRTKAWVPYYYNPQVTLRYQEEGVQNPLTLLAGTDGSLYYVSSSPVDYDGGIVCLVATPADDQEDSRMLKQYGDVMLDFQGSVNAQPYYKNLQSSPVNGPYALGPQSPRGQWIIPIVSSGDGADTSWQRNIGIAISWTTTS